MKQNLTAAFADFLQTDSQSAKNLQDFAPLADSLSKTQAIAKFAENIFSPDLQIFASVPFCASLKAGSVFPVFPVFPRQALQYRPCSRIFRLTAPGGVQNNFALFILTSAFVKSRVCPLKGEGGLSI